MRRLAVAAGLAFAATLLAARPAFAGGVDPVCENAYVEGQKLYKLEHRLLLAREQLLVCARQCPDELRVSCGRWLQEIGRDVPTIVVKARDGAGHDVVDAKVDVDGHGVDGYADGTPIELDPGGHTVRVSRPGKEPRGEFILLHAGEKLRVVDLWLEPPLSPLPALSYSTVTRRPAPVASYVLLGVGALALASFGVLATWTTVEYSDASACAPCQPQRKDAAFSVKAAAADVSLGVAGVSLAGAGVFYLLRPRVTERVPTVTVKPTVGLGGTGLSIAGFF